MKELQLTIHGEHYILISDYKDNDGYRLGLNRLVKKTFAFDFEDWYQGGYWRGRYIPYSLLHKDELVANVSVSIHDYLVDGVKKTYLQIGTVVTEEEYRGKGLSRVLVENILKEYEGLELIYLYANDSVLEFYPRFGFVAGKEFVHSKLAQKSGKQMPYRKLDMDSELDRGLLLQLAANTLPMARISMLDNPGLPMFYLTKFMRDNIYYFEELQLAAVAELESDTMVLTDIFTIKEFALEDVICSLMDRPTMRVVLGFTPRETEGYDCEPIVEEGSTFFVRSMGTDCSTPLGHGRFPILSHT